MIPDVVARVGMYQSGQRTPVYDQPGYESAELCGIEEVDFEHCDRVRADGFVPDFVDAEFGDCLENGNEKG